jgi:hypothetical protein
MINEKRRYEVLFTGVVYGLSHSRQNMLVDVVDSPTWTCTAFPKPRSRVPRAL